MRVLDPGHRYELQGNKETGATALRFYKDARIHGTGYGGTTNQEVARALIDRLMYLEVEQPWGGDLHMIANLRDLILMHEVRAATRKGKCPTDAMRRMAFLPRIEDLPPRVEDGHVYPLDLHDVSACGGRCEPGGEHE